MNYILFNPKSNSENNDLNIIPGKQELERLGVKQLSLIDLNVREFCDSLESGDRVLICGGDGTLHHFANNTRGIEFPCPVFLVRSGTGNDFLNDIGQTDNEDLVDIREYISELPVVEIDGEERSFINGVGMGMDGEVCSKVEQYKQRTGKKASYKLIALKLLAYKYKHPSATITVDGVEHKFNDVWMACAMHGRFFGGGMMISPTQDRTSGKLSVMVMHGGARAKILSIFPSVYKGKHIKHTDIVTVLEGDEVTVSYNGVPLAFQADGETKPEIYTYTARSVNALRKQAESAEEALTTSI